MTTPTEPESAFSEYLFGIGLVVTSIVVLWKIEDFPIYFFCDEAILTNIGREWIAHALWDGDGTFLPMYFQIAPGRSTPFFPAYLQGAAALLLGNSVLLSRTISAVVSLVGVIALALFLRDSKVRVWWVTPYLFGVVPAWIIWARTAFDVPMALAFLSLFTLYYGRYRMRSDSYWPLVALSAAACYYTYASSQVYFPLLVALLFITDLRFHLRRGRSTIALIVAAALVLTPAIYFNLHSQVSLFNQLRALDSFVVKDIPLSEKASTFVGNYLRSLSPQYWSGENEGQNIRHRFLGYPYFAVFLSPFLLLGLLRAFFSLRACHSRLLACGLCVIPIPGSLFEPEINRVMPLIVPFVGLTAMGIDIVIARIPARSLLSTAIAGALAMQGFHLLDYALTKGAFWSADYGLYGLQYGARQLFAEAIPEFLRKHPTNRLVVSSNWANAPSYQMAFFLPSELQRRVRITNPGPAEVEQLPFTQDELFIITSADLELLRKSPGLYPPKILGTIPTPDGQVGFYLVKLQYTADAPEQLQAARTLRRTLIEEETEAAGERIFVKHSRIDIGTVANLFDSNESTLARSAGINPFEIQITFPRPHPLLSLELTIDSHRLRWSVEAVDQLGKTLQQFSDSVESEASTSKVYVPVANLTRDIATLRIQVVNGTGAEPDYVHIREISWKWRGDGR